jgi:uncharacterized protein YifE (UPF0438 family)
MENQSAGNLGSNMLPLKDRVAADHAMTETQLKAEHTKEMANLKAEEAQATAALKAQHAKTPGDTGLLAKITGKEDPIKKAEKQQLKAEIARAEETTKAQQAYEKAELNARKAKESATVNAADKLVHDDSRFNNNGTGFHGANSGFGSNTTGLHHGSNILPAAGGAALAGNALPGTNLGNNVGNAYNHATGAQGVAAFADNGLHREHGAGFSGSNNQAGIQQAPMVQPVAAVPVTMMAPQGRTL